MNTRMQHLIDDMRKGQKKHRLESLDSDYFQFTFHLRRNEEDRLVPDSQPDCAACPLMMAFLLSIDDLDGFIEAYDEDTIEDKLPEALKISLAEVRAIMNSVDVGNMGIAELERYVQSERFQTEIVDEQKNIDAHEQRMGKMFEVPTETF